MTKDTTTQDYAWRTRIISLVDLGRDLKYIEEMLRCANATATYTDNRAYDCIDEAYFSARRLAKTLDQLRRR